MDAGLAVPLLNALDAGADPALALRSAPIDYPALLRRSEFRNETYHRILLHRDEAREVRLICWQPGQSSSLHSHGAADCAFRVLRGSAEELNLHTGWQRHHADVISATPQHEVHQVMCTGEPLVTLHIYQRPLPVDQPSLSESAHVLVVGGGLSGVASALRLLQRGGRGLRVTLVDAGPHLFRGVAYGAAEAAHLLNTPAGCMSLDPEDSDAFVRFAVEHGHACTARSLLPRRLYGDYLAACVSQAVVSCPGKLRIVQGSAVDLEQARGAWRLSLEDGRVLAAENVVLATGHLPPSLPAACAAVAHDARFVRDPWEPGALDRVAAAQRVLVVGSGLTALDVLASLAQRGHQGSVFTVSQSGRWPASHLPSDACVDPLPLDLEAAPRSAEGLAQWLGIKLSEARQHGRPWQAVMQALRPHISALWAALDASEQRHFLRTYLGTWNKLRHRAPHELSDTRRKWEARGWLKTLAGTVRAVRPMPSGLEVELETATGVVARHFDRVVLCTGAATDVHQVRTGLWRNLVRRGLVERDAEGLGIITDASGGVITAHPSPQASESEVSRAVDESRRQLKEAPARSGGSTLGGLYAVGGMLRPVIFESTSAPDIVRQADVMAQALTAHHQAYVEVSPQH